MSIRIVHRPARTTPALQSLPEVPLESPPTLADGSDGAGSAALRILPLLGAGAAMTVMMLFRRSNFAVIGALMMIVTVIASGVMMFSQRGRAGKERRESRDVYIEYLEKERDKLRADETKQLADAHRIHPAPGELLSIARSPDRLWERRRGDDDFLKLRIGIGTVHSRDIKVKSPQGSITRSDPFMDNEVELIKSRFSNTPNMPLLVNLDSIGAISVVGKRDFVQQVARLLTMQAATFHSPEDLQLALVVDDEHREDWDWFSWLPQLAAQNVQGPFGPGRVIVPSIARLRNVLGPELDSRSSSAAEARRAMLTGKEIQHGRILVLVDQYGQAATTFTPTDPQIKLSQVSTTVVYLLDDRRAEPGFITTRISAGREPGSFVVETYPKPDAAPKVVTGFLDDLNRDSTNALAHFLSPLRLSPDSHEHDAARNVMTFAELLGVPDYNNIDFSRAWAPRGETGFLRVAIGTDDMGEPVTLDLKEAAQYGMGPHGLCVGATGSGKSEMLRTLVLGLLVSHDPEDLAMVLVDYKGGATFAPFDGAPQVSGIITNLSDDASLIERVYASLSGEVQRRQQVLRDAGNIADITTYRALRAERPELGLAPFPHLLVIIDEFGELLTASPDLVDLLLTIGRIGRSIGVHLLLSSQRIEAGKLRGLDTYLSYRICLRTFTEAESSTVIGVSDAFHLPAVPGYGYLKVDTSIFTRFRSGFVSGPIDTIDEQPAPDEIEERVPLLLPTYNGLEEESSVTIEDDVPEGHTTRTTVVDTVVSQLAQAAPVSSPVWLDPLPSRLTLSRLHSTSLRRGRSAVPVPPVPSVSVPIGIVDDPAQQRQDPWLLDLTLGGGHVSITGAPQSGRTSFLWTLATSAALCLPPSRLAFYGIDATGGGLSRLSGLPNVGGIATRGDRERMRRVVEEIVTMLDTREQVFSRHRIDSLDVLRSRHAAGQIPELASADVVLLVDGLGLLRSDFEELEDSLDDILRRGSGLGVHAVMTLSRSNELRMAQQPLVGTRLELRLNDPADSLIARKLSKTLRADVPGRVLTPDQLFAHTALPIADDTDTSHGVGTALEELAERIANGWSGERPAPVRMLPEAIDPADLPDGEEEPDLLPLGLFQDTMTPINLDLVGRDPHLLVLGDPGCGKSTVLRGVIESLVERHTPDELVIAVYDMRRTTADACPESYLGGHATSAALAEGLSASIAQELERRSAAMSAGQEPDGPRIVLVVDDYDILAAGNSNPLAPVIPYLSSARDLRLNVALTRPVAGSSQAMYDQLLQALRNTGATGLLMDGERSEGIVLAGMRAEHLRPGRGWWIRRGGRPRLAQVADYGQSPS